MIQCACTAHIINTNFLVCSSKCILKHLKFPAKEEIMDQEGLVPIKAPRKSLLKLKRLISKEEPKDCERFCADNSVFVEMDELRDLHDLHQSQIPQDEQSITLRDDLEKPKNRMSSIYGSIKDFISILKYEQKPNFTSPTRIKLTPSQLLTLVEAQERLKAYKSYCEGHKREELKYRTLNKIPENIDETLNIPRIAGNVAETPIRPDVQMLEDSDKNLMIANLGVLQDIEEDKDIEEYGEEVFSDDQLDDAIDSCIGMFLLKNYYNLRCFA